MKVIKFIVTLQISVYQCRPPEDVLTVYGGRRRVPMNPGPKVEPVKSEPMTVQPVDMAVH